MGIAKRNGDKIQIKYTLYTLCFMGTIMSGQNNVSHLITCSTRPIYPYIVEQNHNYIYIGVSVRNDICVHVE